MDYHFGVLAVSLAAIAAGCAAPGPPFIEQMQPEAVSMATRRAQSEMNCPAATGQLISRETAQPLSFYAGVPRAVYTVEVAGCGKKATYYAGCPNDGSRSCVVGPSRDEVQ